MLCISRCRWPLLSISRKSGASRRTAPGSGGSPWYPPASARRDLACEITAADGAPPASSTIAQSSRQRDGAVRKEEDRGSCSPTNTNHHGMKNDRPVKVGLTTDEIIAKMRKLSNDVYEGEIVIEDRWPANGIGGIWRASILEGSSHRDGAIYKRNWGYWRPGRRIDLADRTETVLDLNKFSESGAASFPCLPDQESCFSHPSAEMTQVFSLRLAKPPATISSDSAAPMLLYGYMASRDWTDDGKLNYIFNRSRDNPLIIQQHDHHLIEMTGPTRGIVLITDVFIEFDMKIIKTTKEGYSEEAEAEADDDDLQLIDGLTCLCGRLSMEPSTLRFHGGYGGAVDISLARIEHGMEALIQVVVVISQVVQKSAVISRRLSLVAAIDVDWHGLEEAQLFHGAIAELGAESRFVVPVPDDTLMHLKFKLVGEKGSNKDDDDDDDVVHCCSFNSNQHGCVSRQIELGVACIDVKVTVSSPFP